MPQPMRKIRNDYALNLFIPHELKRALQVLAEQYDRPLAEIVRVLLRIGIPILQRLHSNEARLLEKEVDRIVSTQK